MLLCERHLCSSGNTLPKMPKAVPYSFQRKCVDGWELCCFSSICLLISLDNGLTRCGLTSRLISLTLLLVHHVCSLCFTFPQPPEKYLLPEVNINDYGKKCVVIDLDETLVHSSFKVIHQLLPIEVSSETARDGLQMQCDCGFYL